MNTQGALIPTDLGHGKLKDDYVVLDADRKTVGRILWTKRPAERLLGFGRSPRGGRNTRMIGAMRRAGRKRWRILRRVGR